MSARTVTMGALLCTALACGRGAPPTAEPTTPVATPTTPVLRETTVHACGLAASDVVKAVAGTSGRELAVQRDGDGCACFVADPASMTILSVMTTNGLVLLRVLPVPGAIEATLQREPEPAFVIEPADDASRVVMVLATYYDRLRGKVEPVVRSEALAALEAVPAGPVRDAWALATYSVVRTPSAAPTSDEIERVHAIIRELPPESWAWTLEWEAIVLAHMHGDVPSTYVERVAEAHPDPDVRAAAAFAIVDVGRRNGDLAATRAAIAHLRADEAAMTSVFARMAEAYDPDRGIREGEPPPMLALVAAERPDTPVELAALRGRVVVLHFWSTWCSGCLEGVAALEQLAVEHRERSLTIVSIELDENPDAVAEFRKRKHPMRWQHARSAGEAMAEIRTRFEITGSTKTIVLDPDGVVVTENLAPSDPLFATTLAESLDRAAVAAQTRGP